MTAPFAGTGRANFTGMLEARFRVRASGGGDFIQLDGATLASLVADLSAVTPSELTDAINAQITRSPALSGQVAASLTVGGRLSLATTATGAAASLTLQAAQPTAGSTSADLGIVTLPGRLAISPMVFATSPYTTTDLSDANTKTVTLGDGASSVTYTFDAGSQPTAANRAAITGAEMSAMFLRERRRVDGDFYMKLTNYGGQDRFVATTRFGGPASSISVSGADAAAFGFTPGQSAVGSEQLGYSLPRSGTGRDGNQPLQTRGRLDTAGSSGYAIATVDVSGQTGPSGDAVLPAPARRPPHAEPRGRKAQRRDPGRPGSCHSGDRDSSSRRPQGSRRRSCSPRPSASRRAASARHRRRGRARWVRPPGPRPNRRCRSFDPRSGRRRRSCAGRRPLRGKAARSPRTLRECLNRSEEPRPATPGRRRAPAASGARTAGRRRPPRP